MAWFLGGRDQYISKGPMLADWRRIQSDYERWALKGKDCLDEAPPFPWDYLAYEYLTTLL